MRAACLSSSVLWAAVALAADPADPPRSRWEIGLVGGAAVQQAYPGAEQHTRRAGLAPYFIFRGEHLTFDRGRVSVRALRTPTFEIDVGTAGSLGASASEVKVREGMPDLGDLIEIGPRLTWNLGQGADPGRWRLQLPLRGVFDLGDELAWRGVTFEPEFEFRHRAGFGWTWSAGLGAIVGSQRFNDLYYQVDPAFATATRPAYDARAGLVAWRLSSSLSHWFTPDWRVFVSARLDSVAGAANRASPLVQRTSGASAGIGLQWVLFRSKALAPD